LAKLSQRGIPPQVGKDLVEQESADGMAQDRLRKALDLKLKKPPPHILSPREKRRLAGYLRQRGYEWEDIWEALRETGGSTEE